MTHVAVLLLLAGGFMAGLESSLLASPAVESRAAALQVRSFDGLVAPVFSGDPREVVVLFFIAPECPVSNRTLPAMRRLYREFTDGRTKVFGVYADPSAPVSALQHHARAYELDFPLWIDRDLTVARYGGVTRTPEAVIADGTGALIYRGRIDDRFVTFGRERQQPTREEVRDILLALRAGHRPEFRVVPGFGCTLNRPVASP